MRMMSRRQGISKICISSKSTTMEGLRMTVSLSDSPLKEIPRTREVQLHGADAPSSSLTHDNVPHDDDDDDDAMLDSLTSINEDEHDLSDDTMSDIIQEPRDEIEAPPTIRRRRMNTSSNGGHDICRLQSLSFIATNDNDDLFAIKNDTMEFPTTKSQHKTRISEWTMTLTCRAISLLICILLLLCVLLSHYTFTEPIMHEDNDMTISKQQVLLKSYLGDVQQGSFASNVKLPAGGNPIDLIHLLHSSIIKEEEEHTSDVSKLDVRMAIVLCVLCTLMAADMNVAPEET